MRFNGLLGSFLADTRHRRSSREGGKPSARTSIGDYYYNYNNNYYYNYYFLGVGGGHGVASRQGGAQLGGCGVGQFCVRRRGGISECWKVCDLKRGGAIERSLTNTIEHFIKHDMRNRTYAREEEKEIFRERSDR